MPVRRRVSQLSVLLLLSRYLSVKVIDCVKCYGCRCACAEDRWVTHRPPTDVVWLLLSSIRFLNLFETFKPLFTTGSDVPGTANMLLLFETAAGFALFKVNKEDKLEKSDVSVFLSCLRGEQPGQQLIRDLTAAACRTCTRTSRLLTQQRR
jgi:hypothetical protein